MSAPDDWDFPVVLHCLPVNARTFGESISAPRVSYTRTDTIPSDPRVKALVELLRRADEELRLIRMKDTGAVYDILLRTDLTAALAALAAMKGAANE